jgi:hypothetical protein
LLPSSLLAASETNGKIIVGIEGKTFKENQKFKDCILKSYSSSIVDNEVAYIS